jgi:putative peptidoglycan lipid II flippase
LFSVNIEIGGFTGSKSPVAAGLAALSVPIIQMIYQYWRFGPQDTLSAAETLAAYAAGLVFYSGVKVLVPACYATGQTRLAVWSSVLSVVANLGLNLWLVGPFGFVGLAFGTSATALLNFVFLLIVLKVPIRSLIQPFAVYFGIAAVMAGACLGSYRAVLAWFALDSAPPVWARVSLTLGLVFEGIAVCLVVSRIFAIWTGKNELADAVSRVRARFFARRNDGKKS